MSFELIILGSSSALPTTKRFTTAHLLNVNERFFLIDCGEGTQIQLRKNKLSPARINHIFISHLHGDHVFGLFGLISSMGMMGRNSNLNIYGPAMLQEMLEAHLKFFGPLSFEINYHISLPDKTVFEDSKILVKALKLKHRVETYGYYFQEKEKLLNIDKGKIAFYNISLTDVKRIKEGADYMTEDGRCISNKELTLPPWHRRSYAYISDTAYLAGLSSKIFGVDLLYHETTFLEKDSQLAKKTFHSTVKQAALVAVEANASKLLIGHFSSRYKKEHLFAEEGREVFKETIAVNDGDRFEVRAYREKV